MMGPHERRPAPRRPRPAPAKPRRRATPTRAEYVPQEEKAAAPHLRAGRASRCKAEEFILAGRVTVNGRKAVIRQRALPGDDVRLDGKHPEPGRVTYLLRKPAGCLPPATARTPHGADLLPPTPGLHPVGASTATPRGCCSSPPTGVTPAPHPPTLQGGGSTGCGAEGRERHGAGLTDGWCWRTAARAVQAGPAPGGAVVVLTEGRAGGQAPLQGGGPHGGGWLDAPGQP